jgi:hypothetical protein
MVFFFSAVSYELGRMWKETIMAYRYVCLGVLTTATKNYLGIDICPNTFMFSVRRLAIDLPSNESC